MPQLALAERTVVIRGETDIGSTYQSNVYHTKSDTISEWNSFISPTITYSSQGLRNLLSIEYNPEYSRNHRRDVTTKRHDVDATFLHQFSRKFNMEFTNNFSYIDRPGAEMNGYSLAMDFVRLNPEQQVAVVNLLFYDINWPGGEFDPTNPAQVAFVQTEIQIRYDAASPEIQAEVDGIMRQSADDNKYWNNSTAFNGFFQYDRNNLISFGYTYRKTKNDADYLGNDEFHQPFVSLEHTFSADLDLLLSYNYYNSKREISGDSNSHITLFRLTYDLNHANTIHGEYSNEQVSFDGNQSSQTVHRIDMGYNHRFNPQTTFDISALPFIIDRDETSDERGYSITATLSRALKAGQLSLEARTNYSELDTTGSWESFRETWLVRTDFDHKFSQKIRSNIFATYAQTSSWYAKSKSTYTLYTGGADTTYAINKWLDISLEYRYTFLNSDNTLIDEATNNTVTLKLSTANDLWRW